MARQAKFSFVKVSEQALPSSEQYYATLKKNGQLSLSKRFVIDHGFDESIIEFFVDSEKHSVAFRKLAYKMNELSEEQRESLPKLVREVRINGAGIAQVGIGRIMKHQSWYKPANYRLVLQEYKDSMYGTLWYFVVDGDESSTVEEENDD